MFRIPDFYQTDTTFEQAQITMKHHGRGDMLAGMEAMLRSWEEHCSGSDRFDTDDDFFEWYEAEVNAYNTVYETMSALFKQAEQQHV